MTTQRDPVPAHTLARLTFEDAWLLAGVFAAEGRGRPATMVEVIDDMDFAMRDAPYFDLISFGVPRLTTAGLVGALVEPGGTLRISTTPAAAHLRSIALPAPFRLFGYESVTALAEELGADRWDGPGDPSLGRLPGYTDADFRRAETERARVFDASLRDILRSRRSSSVIVALLAMFALWVARVITDIVQSVRSLWRR